jgi:hypothetical protein
MDDLEELNELLRAADETFESCECCGELSHEKDSTACAFCNKYPICCECITWYLHPNNKPKPGPQLTTTTLPPQYRPFYKGNHSKNDIAICSVCSIDVEAMYIKHIPYIELPKYINYIFIHEQNKALLLKRIAKE